ncbi:hypothetical protein RIF29_19490 [Crotalaria pallida]|uniref:Uncharacterized protein n=1 Tax=Crotalaria pallida TaxID=3830 RepID=A0AAN9F3M5_CROPI
MSFHQVEPLPKIFKDILNVALFLSNYPSTYFDLKTLLHKTIARREHEYKDKNMLTNHKSRSTKISLAKILRLLTLKQKQYSQKHNRKEICPPPIKNPVLKTMAP